MNHYKTLGVAKDADQMTIKRAYRRKSKAAHPDRKGGSHAAMSEVNRAYALLSDATKRAHYDQTGEEQITPLEQNAKNALAALVSELVEHYASHNAFNLVAKLREVIKSKTVEIKTNTSVQRRKADKIERVLKKHLKPNKNANKMLVHIIEHQLQQARSKVAELEQHQEIGALMLKMLEGYGWEDEAVDQALKVGTWSSAAFAFGIGGAGKP